MNMVMGATSHVTTKEIEANVSVMSGKNLQIEAMATSLKTDSKGRGLGFNQAKEAVTH